MHRNLSNTSGFSVIEVLVGIFILTLVGVAVAIFQKDVFSLNTVLSNSLVQQQEARVVLKEMADGIRSAAPSSTGAYPVVQASSISFTFYTDTDDDNLKERIRYFLDGAVLKRGVLKPSGNPLTYNPVNETVSELIHNITNGTTSVFGYYDTSYDGTTPPLNEPVNPLAVRLVKITAIIDRDPLRPPSPITVTTQVTMRNIKDNL